MSPEQFQVMINRESGLLGVSGISSDLRDLQQATDPRAAEAVELFCYQVKKWIGSFVAVLGGLDTLVFTGGIGENAPEIRARICEGLEVFGIQIDAAANQTNAAVISRGNGQATVRVMKTDEELVIVDAVRDIVCQPTRKESHG